MLVSALASAIVLSIKFTLTEADTPDIYRIGSDIFPSSSTLDAPGRTFLANEAIPSSGILFAFSAYLVADTPFSLQLWRPMTKTPDQGTFRAFQMIADIPFNSSTLLTKLDVYFDRMPRQQLCYKTLPGDRLGVSFPGRWPIPYVFNPENQQVYTFSFNTSNPPQVNDVFEIDQLIFPYRFSVAAWILNNSSSSTASGNQTSAGVTCPSGLTIPSMTMTVAMTTTTPPRTGAPGATGATGATGQIGDTGATGVTGPFGATGVLGATGPMGATGSTGSPGAIGVMGSTGARGNYGATGPMGLPGPKGATGATGPSGPQGPPGPSANVSGSASQPRTGASNQMNNNNVKWWRRQSIIVGVYIWLAIVSFLALVVLIWTLVLCGLYCRLKTYRKKSDRNYGSYLNAYATN